jgi:PTS system nitrogen regulatory IIA component
MAEAHVPLEPDFIVTDSTAGSKEELLEECAEQAATSPTLSKFNKKKLYKFLKQREDVGSTGFGDGVAIPHCSIEGLKSFVVGLIIIPAGVDFHAMDGNPVHIAFVIIGPTEQRNRHIKILSEISKMVRNEDVRQKLMAPESVEATRRLLAEHLTIQKEQPATEGYCLINVYLQKEEIFEELLELFSSEVEGSITVIETQNAGAYLYKMPLFSSYWNTASSSFNRLVQAVVPKSSCNNLIRQINLIEDSFSDDPGLMITAQDLMYASGSINF